MPSLLEYLLGQGQQPAMGYPPGPPLPPPPDRFPLAQRSQNVEQPPQQMPWFQGTPYNVPPAPIPPGGQGMAQQLGIGDINKAQAMDALGGKDTPYLLPLLQLLQSGTGMPAPTSPQPSYTGLPPISGLGIRG